MCRSVAIYPEQNPETFGTLSRSGPGFLYRARCMVRADTGRWSLDTGSKPRGGFPLYTSAKPALTISRFMSVPFRKMTPISFYQISEGFKL